MEMPFSKQATALFILVVTFLLGISGQKGKKSDWMQPDYIEDRDIYFFSVPHSPSAHRTALSGELTLSFSTNCHLEPLLSMLIQKLYIKFATSRI